MMSNNYDQYSNYLDEISPRARKNMGKKKFHVYDENGNLIMPALNKFPACAAKKAVSKGHTKIVVYDPLKNRWYGYIGKRVKIPANKLTEHQRDHGMNYVPKAYSHKIEDVAKPEFLREILGLNSKDTEEYIYENEMRDGDYEGCEEEVISRKPRGNGRRQSGGDRRWF